MEEQKTPFPVKKAFLYSLVASIALTALFGMGTILSNRWSWFEVRILLTTLTVGGSSVCGLANAAFLSTRRGLVLPLVGVGLSLAGGLLIVWGIWTDTMGLEYWKTTVSFCVFSVACAHLSLLSMARLAEWFQWSLVAAYATILGVASLMVFMIVWETQSAGMFQFLALAAIFDAAITILIPIFHKLSLVHEEERATRQGTASATEAIDAEIAALKARIEELERKKKSLI